MARIALYVHFVLLALLSVANTAPIPCSGLTCTQAESVILQGSQPGHSLPLRYLPRRSGDESASPNHNVDVHTPSYHLHARVHEGNANRNYHNDKQRTPPKSHFSTDSSSAGSSHKRPTSQKPPSHNAPPVSHFSIDSSVVSSEERPPTPPPSLPEHVRVTPPQWLEKHDRDGSGSRVYHLPDGPFPPHMHHAANQGGSLSTHPGRLPNSATLWQGLYQDNELRAEEHSAPAGQDTRRYGQVFDQHGRPYGSQGRRPSLGTQHHHNEAYNALTEKDPNDPNKWI